MLLHHIQQSGQIASLVDFVANTVKISTVVRQGVIATDLAFSLPVLEVIEAAPPTDIYELTATYEHVASWNNVRDWRLARIVPT